MAVYGSNMVFTLPESCHVKESPQLPNEHVYCLKATINSYSDSSLLKLSKEVYE